MGREYVGYPLKNEEGTNRYPGLNVNECAEFCEITTNCLYFQLSQQWFYGKWQFYCYLKHGLSQYPARVNSYISIGYKYIAGMALAIIYVLQISLQLTAFCLLMMNLGVSVVSPVDLEL